MKNCLLLIKIVREGILGICLFPATFVFYQTWKDWFDAFGTGKNFILPIQDNIHELITQECKRNTIHRLLVGLPLRFARRGLLFGCRRAFLSGVGLKHQFKHFPPAQVDLVPGLLQNTTEARQQAHKLIKKFSEKKISISEYAHCFFGEGSFFKGERVAVIAHWDPDNFVDPYVIHQCQHFRSLGFKVLLTSSAKPERFDVQSCSDWLDAFVFRTCGGYDFTSWKAALEVFPSLYSAREVILTNDSYFSPIGSFETVHRKMMEVPCDFWGLVRCNQIRPHLQSYYLVLKKQVVMHPAFKNFFDRVSLSGDRDNAVFYETSFSLWLSLHHFHPAAYIPIPMDSQLNYTFEFWEEIIKSGIPILKREFFIRKNYQHRIKNWKSVCTDKNYPTDLIEKYLERQKIHHLNL